MTPAEKEPYETLSNDSKAEYARLKQLTPAERIMVMAAQALHHPVSSLLCRACCACMHLAEYLARPAMVCLLSSIWGMFAMGESGNT